MKYIQKTIEQCSDILPGILEQKSADEAGWFYKAVMPCQITPDGFIREYGQLQRTMPVTASFLEIGDVLIKRLNPDCAVVFEDDSIKVLPSANLFVIRPNTDMLDPYYLAFILESSKALTRISQRFGIGTAVSAVTINQIRSCEIPLPSLDEQRQMGALWVCAKKRNNLLRELITENNRLLRSMGEKLYQ